MSILINVSDIYSNKRIKNRRNFNFIENRAISNKQQHHTTFEIFTSKAVKIRLRRIGY